VRDAKSSLEIAQFFLIRFRLKHEALAAFVTVRHPKPYLTMTLHN
jgi:hypothetical protein